MIDERTAEMGRTWRRCNPAHARQLAAVWRTITETGDDADAWRAVWGRFVVAMAEQVHEGRPLSKRQDNALIGALRDAHRRRWERFPESSSLMR